MHSVLGREKTGQLLPSCPGKSDVGGALPKKIIVSAAVGFVGPCKLVY